MGYRELARARALDARARRVAGFGAGSYRDPIVIDSDDEPMPNQRVASAQAEIAERERIERERIERERRTREKKASSSVSPKMERGKSSHWNTNGYIAVELDVEENEVRDFLRGLNGALRSWYLAKLDDAGKHNIAAAQGVREYLAMKERQWPSRPDESLLFLDDIWNLPAKKAASADSLSRAEAKLVQTARQGGLEVAQGNSDKAMLLNGFGYISHIYGLRFVWALLPSVIHGMRAYEPGSDEGEGDGSRLHLTGLPHLIIKPPRTGEGTKLKAHVDGGSIKDMLDRCRDVLREEEPTVETWVRKFGFQSLVHVVGSDGHTSILGPMTVARYALVLSMIEGPHNEASGLPASDDEWLRHPDMETCFDAKVKSPRVIMDAFVAKLRNAADRAAKRMRPDPGPEEGDREDPPEPEEERGKPLINAHTLAKVVAAARILVGEEGARAFRDACAEHIAHAETVAAVAAPTSARSAMYVMRKYLLSDGLDARCAWDSDKPPPNFCDVLYSPKCLAVLNRVLRAVVSEASRDEASREASRDDASRDETWIRRWRATDLGARVTVVLRKEAGGDEVPFVPMAVIPITTGSRKGDQMPYVAMWPDGFIHGSNAMKHGPRVSIAVPVATTQRLGATWGSTDETLDGRMRRGIARIDAIAAGDFDAVMRDAAPYATGRSHRAPQSEVYDAQHFRALYVTMDDWPDIKRRMCEEGILPAACLRAAMFV